MCEKGCVIQCVAHTPLWCEAKEVVVSLVAYASASLELCPETREKLGGVHVWKGVCQALGFRLRKAVFFVFKELKVGGWVGLIFGQHMQSSHFNRAGARWQHICVVGMWWLCGLVDVPPTAMHTCRTSMPHKIPRKRHNFALQNTHLKTQHTGVG